MRNADESRRPLNDASIETWAGQAATCILDARERDDCLRIACESHAALRLSIEILSGAAQTCGSILRKLMDRAQLLGAQRRSRRYVPLVLMVAVLARTGEVILAQDEAQKSPATPLTSGLVGHWPLRGDCQDHSGRGNHGVNHGVALGDGTFDGVSAYLEVPASDSLSFGTRDFTLSTWVYTPDHLDDAVGDVLDMYDPATRRGITLAINSSASGYVAQGTDRHVYFGIDNAQLSEWEDCGRPSPTSVYVSNSMLVFAGHLYAAVIEGATEEDWCHVYRYEGGQKWADCGRVGDGRTTGVGPLFVHRGELHAVTTTYDWTRVQTLPFDPGRVYRYRDGTMWEDLGQPSENRTLNCAASFRGQIYVGGGPNQWGVFVRNQDARWVPSILFPMSGPRKCFPHASARYNGRLYVGFPSVYAYDGNAWTYVGVPVEPESTLQTHSFTIYQGRLTAGTWPLAKVARYLEGESWEEMGRVGGDGTEVNSLVVYNGKLYGGSIPRAEVCRYDDAPQWTSLRRFYSPEGWTPVPPRENGGRPTREQVAEWSRVTSMTIHRGRLFASIGNCTSSVKDSPADVRGSVHSLEAGKCVSFDGELAPGWCHLAAVRVGGRLRLYVNGELAAESSSFEPSDYDLTNHRPLRIGFGQVDFFHGKINDVRAYNRALSEDELRALFAMKPN
jgi:hypothetical protein